jgi:hypothetical protein
MAMHLLCCRERHSRWMPRTTQDQLRDVVAVRGAAAVPVRGERPVLPGGEQQRHGQPLHHHAVVGMMLMNDGWDGVSLSRCRRSDRCLWWD